MDRRDLPRQNLSVYDPPEPYQGDNVDFQSRLGTLAHRPAKASHEQTAQDPLVRARSKQACDKCRLKKCAVISH